MDRLFLHDPLAAEMEVFEPVKKKTWFDTITESDGELLISYLSVSYYPDCVAPQTVLCQCYIVFIFQLKMLTCVSR